MAVLTSDQFTPVYQDGSCGKTALFALKNTTAGDTLDVASYFRFVKRAGIVSETGTTIATVTVTGATNLTVPAGPANDAVWLLVVGVSS